jgi:hypothetical protein
MLNEILFKMKFNEGENEKRINSLKYGQNLCEFLYVFHMILN